MTRRPLPALLALVCILGTACACTAKDITFETPARNWALPLFSKEGYHTLTLRGSSATPVGTDRIDVSDINITVFSGDASAKVETVVLSPAATFLFNERFAKGPTEVRLIRDDLEVSGAGWSYDFREKKVSIARNTRVVFYSALPDILK